MLEISDSVGLHAPISRILHVVVVTERDANMFLSRERVNASGDGTLGKVQEQKISSSSILQTPEVKEPRFSYYNEGISKRPTPESILLLKPC